MADNVQVDESTELSASKIAGQEVTRNGVSVKRQAIQVDPPPGSIEALANATSTANEASHVIKAGAGRLFGVTGYNAKTSAQFIQLHNTTSVPADTAVPVLTFKVPASDNFSLDLGIYGRYFSTGISICNSSTQATKTIGSADCFFDVQYL